MNSNMTLHITRGNGPGTALPLADLLTPLQAPSRQKSPGVLDFSALFAMTFQEDMPAGQKEETSALLDSLQSIVTQLQQTLSQDSQSGKQIELDEEVVEALGESLEALQAWLQSLVSSGPARPESQQQTEGLPFSAQPLLDGVTQPKQAANIHRKTELLQDGKILPPAGTIRVSMPESEQLQPVPASVAIESATTSSNDAKLSLIGSAGAAPRTDAVASKWRQIIHTLTQLQARLAAVGAASGKNGGDPIPQAAQVDKTTLQALELDATGQQEDTSLALSMRDAGMPRQAEQTPLMKTVARLRQLLARHADQPQGLKQAIRKLEAAIQRQQAVVENPEQALSPSVQGRFASVAEGQASGAHVHGLAAAVLPTAAQAARINTAGGEMPVNRFTASAASVSEALRTMNADADAETTTDDEAGMQRGSEMSGGRTASATGTDTLSSMRLPLRHPQWGDQLAQRVMMLATSNRQQAQIRLHPAHLGPIEVSLKAEGDKGLQVSLHAQHVLTREAIEQALPRLRELFEAQGIALADVQVQADGRGHAQAFAEAHRALMQEARESRLRDDQAETSPSSDPVEPLYVSTALVDHFV